MSIHPAIRRVAFSILYTALGVALIMFCVDAKRLHDVNQLKIGDCVMVKSTSGNYDREGVVFRQVQNELAKIIVSVPSESVGEVQYIVHVSNVRKCEDE